MLSTTSGFNEAINANYRDLDVRVTVGEAAYSSDEIVSFSYSHGVIGDRFEIGLAPSAYIKVTLAEQSLNVSFDGKSITAEIGVNVDGTYEYVALGQFYVDESSRDMGLVTLHGMDAMVQLETEYESKLSYPAKVQNVLNEIMNGFSSNIVLPTYVTQSTYTVKKLDKVSKRQALSYIATICGATAIVDRAGSFKFIYPNKFPERNPLQDIDADKYFSLQREDVSYQIVGLDLSDGKNTFSVTNAMISKLMEAGYSFADLSNLGLSFGNISSFIFDTAYQTGQNTFSNLNAMNLSFERFTNRNMTYGSIGTSLYNGTRFTSADRYYLSAKSPYANSFIAPYVLSSISGLPILAYSIEYIGNPALELGDNIRIVEFIDESTQREIFVNVESIEITFDGTLVSRLSGAGDSKNKNAYGTSGSISQEIDSIKTDVAKALTLNENVSATVDLSTIMATGLYYCELPADTAGFNYYGRPNGQTNITLEVISSSDGQNGTQLAYEVDKANNATTYIYKRNWYNNSSVQMWTSWRRVALSSYTIPTI